MLLTTTHLLPLLSTLLITTTHAVTDPFGQPLPGSCNEYTNYPLESEFTTAYTDFCTTHISPSGTPLRENAPIIYTYKLLAGNGQKIDWVLRSGIADDGTPGWATGVTNSSECLRRFKGMLETPIQDKWYCVMDGTGGDAFSVTRNRGVGKETSGEGTVLVWGGKKQQEPPYGPKFEMFEWEARLRKGSD